MSVMTALASFTTRYVKYLGVRKIIEQGIIVWPPELSYDTSNNNTLHSVGDCNIKPLF